MRRGGICQWQKRTDRPSCTHAVRSLYVHVDVIVVEECVIEIRVARAHKNRAVTHTHTHTRTVTLTRTPSPYRHTLSFSHSLLSSHSPHKCTHTHTHTYTHVPSGCVQSSVTPSRSGYCCWCIIFICINNIALKQKNYKRIIKN